MKRSTVRTVILMLVFILTGIIYSSCTGGDSEKDCVNDGGIWYESSCINDDTPEKKLRGIGLLEEDNTEWYEVRIKYPVEVLNYPKIHSHLRNVSETIKSETGIYDAGREPDTTSPPRSLIIDMDNYTSAGKLASVLVYSMSYTGGAHPNHYYQSVTFNTETQEIIDLEELFKESDYIYRISEYVTSRLLRQKSEKTGEEIESDEWIERGALPLPSNFEIFVLVPGKKRKSFSGIKFIFPPYTVGPYSDGTYEVFVPVEIIEDYLAQQYKEVFVTSSQ